MKYFGSFLILLSIAMFVIGVGAFASRGEMNFVLRDFGKFSFTWWLPTLILGGIIMLFTKKKR